jgi:phosphatidylserine decarboxylase
MVKDGIYYALGLAAVAAVVGWLTAWPWAVPPLLLAAFFLWFFRDPERAIPQEPGAIVSPADGKVTEVATVELEGKPRTRISIFLNVFNVHVNRSPIGGVVERVEYRTGKFGNAMGAISAEANEQNIVTVAGEGQTLVFKQIAGLLARRIVFTKKVGDAVARGERIGLIKFGSRCDVIFDVGAQLRVKLGDKVAGGSSVLAIAAVPASAGSIPQKSVEARR